ncbi:MAG: sulfite exporter TauE/SafE family protein [Pseudomonadota bacterium]
MPDFAWPDFAWPDFAWLGFDGAFIESLTAGMQWPSIGLITLTVVTFLLAGLIKGVVGFGLPTVALTMLAAAVGLKSAMAIMVVPALFTNIWQGLSGGALVTLTRRLSGFLGLTLVGIFVGTSLLAATDGRLLAILLGVLILIYAATGLANWSPPKVTTRETWLSPVFGLLNGIVTGLTGSFIMPGLVYLRALDMTRDQMIQGMGIVFTLSSIALAIFLSRQSLMPPELLVASAAGTPAAFVGMALGQQLRSKLSDKGFERLFFLGLVIAGGFLIARNVRVL